MLIFYTLWVIVVLGSSAAQADEDEWIPPSQLQPVWDRAAAEAMPGDGVTDCGVLNSMRALAVITQCTWLSDDVDVGYITSTADNTIICGWGERPEAMMDDWALKVDTGIFERPFGSLPCPPPVRWDMDAP